MSSKKKIRLIILSVVVILSVVMTLTGAQTIGELFGITSAEVSDDFSEGFSVHVIDCGQGSSTLIMSDGKAVLVDGGPNDHAEEVVDYLKSVGITHIDYIVASHPHEDHIGGLDEVLNGFSVGAIIMPKLTKDNQPTTKTYSNLLDAVKNNGCDGIYADVGQEYILGGGLMTVLSPEPNTDYSDLNNSSVVVRFEYSRSTAMVMGDAETVVERFILSTDADIKSDLLVVGHHGSSSSSSSNFLEMVGGSYAAISLGKDNTYGHPHDEVVEALDHYGYIISRTDEVGDIVYVANGGDFKIL